MNKVILMGRLVREPEIRFSQNTGKAVAKYTLAVDRRYSKDGDFGADFLPCVVFGRAAEFAEKYLHKGTKIIVTGRLQTGSYTKDDGTKVYTTDVIVEDQEFAESKAASSRNQDGNTQAKPQESTSGKDDFVELDEDGELPF